ncbi:MAG: Gfo/Idh/MocA family oxidoreductase [Ignavibacteriaceae bacterium]
MSPDNIIIKKLISKNKLGKIFAADLSVKNYRDDNYYKDSAYRGTKNIDGGGPFIQQASHYIDLYAWFFGKPEKIVSMLDTFVHNIETEDYGSAILRHKNGMIGTIIASTAVKPGFDSRFEIHSERGTIILENDIITAWIIERMENPSKAKNMKIHSGASSASVNDTSGHELIIKDFIRSVNENREPCVSGDSAKIATEIILEIYSNKIV